MGNWLKGRVLMNDVSLIGEENNTVNTSNTTTRIHHQSSNQHGPSHGYHVTTSHETTAPHQPQSMPVLQFPPNFASSLLVSQFSEEEQIQLAKRIGLIQHLPTGIYDNGGESKNCECVICMIEFNKGDSIRFLPCLHTYHRHCIDNWLMRSFICPSCMEPVDVALLSIF